MQKPFKIVFCFISLLFLHISLINAQYTQTHFEHITTKQGLPSNNVYSIIKDSSGFMCFATGIGLYRFDGYKFNGYRNDPTDESSLSGNLINSQLFLDESGNLWVGTEDNGLNWLNTSTGSVLRFIHDTKNTKSISHNNVHKIFQDDSGNIWVATLGGGLNKYNKNNHGFIAFLPEPADPSGSANYILSILDDNEGNLLIGTRKGPYIFEKTINRFTPFTIAEEIDSALQLEVIVDIIKNDELLWFGTENGLIKYNRQNKTLTRYQSDDEKKSSLSSNIIRNMLDSPDKKSLWISTVWGLNRFDKQTGKAERFLYKSDDPNSLGYNMLWGMYIDDCNLLWIGTDNAGVNVLDLNENPIKHHKIGGVLPGGEQYTATVFCEDKTHNFWIGTFDGGLWKYDQKMKLLKNYVFHPNSTNTITSNSVFSLCADSHNALWVGTSHGGVNRISDKGIIRFNIKNPDSQRASSSVIEILEDHEGVIWIGTLTGLYTYKNSSGKGIESIHSDPFGDALIRSLCEDRNGNLWIGTHSEGLFKLDKKDRESNRFNNYIHDPDNQGSINSNTVMSVYEDYQGNIWIATIMGLNKYIPDQDRFESFSTGNSLNSDYLYYIQGEDNGILWITSARGLIRFDPHSETNQKSRLLEFQHDNLFDDIYPYSFYRSKTGHIYVGGKHGTDHGFYIFHPDSLKVNSDLPEIVVTDFIIHNVPYKTDSAINAKKVLKLKYDQNFFSFEFAALDYRNPSKNQYAYMLDGLDDDWTFCGNRRFANYTGVPPGDYVFRVKGSNNDGYWNEEGAILRISILPPPWKTWWAYLLYGLFIIGVLYIIIRYYLKRQQLLHKLALEQVQSEKLEELDKMKSTFFTNISHEFRTPLTLILGPLEKLKSKTTDQDCQQDLNVMQRNARRLQILINQLLSLSKLESGQMKLHARQENIVALVNGYLQSFESLAKQKKIKLIFNSSEDSIQTYIDRDKLEKILYNLLSNAFKFTGEGGRIELAVTTLPPSRGEYVVGGISPLEGGQRGVNISISDTGSGIPPEKLEYIFDRFYRADDSYIKNQEGTGIGLALTKELVELHHGNITVESRLGTRTTFTVFLPLGKDHLKPDEIVKPIVHKNSNGESIGREDFFEEQVEQFTALQIQEEISDDDIEEENSKPYLLLVEDNDDLRSYIRSYLDDEYRISEAINGEMGLKKAIEKIPDLVISDVMMPKMDGMELCRSLKTDERTSHIPVILLTAKAGMEDKLEGLETGADDFLTKPFDPKELQVRIRNLIVQRSKLKEQFIRELDITGQMTLQDILSIDRQFLQKAKKTVEENMSDFDFSIEDFAEKMDLSRIQLHRKLKALINQSASDFLRTIRLNHAACLIRSKSGNITQIAFEVGFNNLSYFSKCFREQFGMLPSEYANQNSQS